MCVRNKRLWPIYYPNIVCVSSLGPRTWSPRLANTTSPVWIALQLQAVCALRERERMCGFKGVKHGRPPRRLPLGGYRKRKEIAIKAPSLRGLRMGEETEKNPVMASTAKDRERGSKASEYALANLLLLDGAQRQATVAYM